MKWTEKALEQSLLKIERNITDIGVRFPHVEYEGAYNDQGASFWTAGFWPGMLWLLYQESRNKKAVELAGRLEEELDQVLDGFLSIHHDVGFMWLPSAVIHYKVTHELQSKIRGLKAASHLAGRFNLAGKFIRAWTDEVNPESKGWAIIDCMMNLPLLFWASNETKDPRFYHIAKAHADTVLRNFIRPDNTVAHIVSFNPYTGEKIENLGGQGKDGDSAWARGQAWAVYGMAIAYRETKEEAYLTAAKNIAAYFLSHLPENKVPYWDFRTEEKDQFVLDSSASACIASGLMEMYYLMEEGTERNFYREQAVAILAHLYENFADFSEKTQGIIQQGTVNYAKNKHINVPIIYGDYFFVEALIKLKHPLNIF